MEQVKAQSVLDGDAARFSRSLGRGLSILTCFTAETPALGIVDIAERLGLNRSASHRYADTLVVLGYLEHPFGQGRKYRLASRACDLGMAALNTLALRACARPCLENLRRQISYTVGVAVLDRGEARVVEILRGYRGYARLGVEIGPGSLLPTYCTGVGKVLLAHLPGQECRNILDKLALVQRGPRTITKKRTLSHELQQVQELGFAIAEEELARGVISVAVPVKDGTGVVVAAMGMIAPTSSLSRRELAHRVGPKLVKAAKRLSKMLAEIDTLPAASQRKS